MADPRLGEYRMSHHRCAVCHWPDGRGTPLEIHHLVGRRGGVRCHEHENLIVLCRDCHAGFHSGGGCSLSLGQLLFAKREEDGEVDVEFLASLKGRKGLSEDELPLPDWAEAARVDNYTRGWWRNK